MLPGERLQPKSTATAEVSFGLILTCWGRPHNARGLPYTSGRTYLAGGVVVEGAGAEVDDAAAGDFVCFLCFLTLFVVVVVDLLLSVDVLEAAGACAAIAVPMIRERPATADAMVFMVSIYPLCILEA